MRSWARWFAYRRLSSKLRIAVRQAVIEHKRTTWEWSPRSCAGVGAEIFHGMVSADHPDWAKLADVARDAGRQVWSIRGSVYVGRKRINPEFIQRLAAAAETPEEK